MKKKTPKKKATKTEWKPTSLWFGIPIILAPFLIMLYFSQGIGFGIFCLFFGPIYLPIAGGIMWDRPMPATCYFCKSKNVNCMFQTEIGSIHQACGRHAYKAKASGMRFSYYAH